MRIFLQYVMSGLGTGAIYALLALGFSIIYKGTRSINFAQGQYAVIAGILASVLYRDQGLPEFVAVLIAIVAGLLLGVITEIVAVRFLRRPDPLTVTLATVGLTIAIQAIIILKTNGASYALPVFAGQAPISIGGALLQSQTIWNFGLAVLAIVVLSWFFGRTKRGVSLRAAADDRETASVFGVSAGSTALWIFGLGGILAAVAGVAITPVTLMSSTEGTTLALTGFAAAMLGGLGSIPGAVLGGFLLGLGQTLVAGYISSTYSDLLSFVVLLVVLFTFPRGLIAETIVERV